MGICAAAVSADRYAAEGVKVEVDAVEVELDDAAASGTKHRERKRSGGIKEEAEVADTEPREVLDPFATPVFVLTAMA